jgi:hypothetical protein
VAGAGDVAQFRRLSVQYRAMVWTVLLVCERCVAMGEVGGDERGTGAVVPYGAVPVDLWMLIFEICRRDVPVQHAM